jgi:hypothetical protein
MYIHTTINKSYRLIIIKEIQTDELVGTLHKAAAEMHINARQSFELIHEARKRIFTEKSQL